MLSKAEEDYIKAIYALSKTVKKGISTNAIAQQLQTKASSVTDMIKKLHDKTLVNYKPYQGVTLTAKGNDVAVNIVRKHRLWEVFLVNKLSFSWDEVHEVAEQLEHIHSEKLIDELDAFLDFPRRDPHGDPIPDKNGKIPSVDKVILSKLAVGEKGICVGVKDTSTDFLKYLDSLNIALGQHLEILSKVAFDDSLQIKINNNAVMISSKTANNIYIKQ